MAQAEKTGAVSSPSQDDVRTLVAKMAEMEAKLAQYQEAEEMRKRLGNVDIAFVEGTSKAGKAFGLLKITGGVFGGYGISLRPATWEALKTMIDQIDFKMKEHADSFR
jgi:hypothetical protein